MNAVKRCLALFAATLWVGACGGDPTASDAGANLAIRATPGSVWVQDGKTATVLIEAIDGLNGTQPGNWTAAVTGPFTVVQDTSYQSTSAGPIGNGRSYVVTPTAAGEGFIVFTGTGGADTVPIRIFPNPAAFAVTVSNLLPAIAESIAVTAPAGIRFTATTAVSFVAGGANATNNGLAAPSLLSMSADSTVLYVLPAPGAAGRLRITDVASIATPTLKSTATSVDSVTVPALLSVAAVLSSVTPAANAPLTITMPANFKFRPTSVLSIAGQGFTPILVSRSADSNSVVILPAPGATGAISITNVRFAPLGGLALTLPTSLSVTVGAAANLGPDDAVNGFSFAAPAVIGNSNGVYDLATMAVADPTCDGGSGAQFYTLTVAASGNYKFQVNWTAGSDFDFGVMVKDGSYGSPSCADYLSTAGLASSKPETFTVALTAATTYTIIVIDFAGDHTAATQVKLWLTKQ